MFTFPVSFIQAQSDCVAVQGSNVVPQTGTANADDIPMDTWYKYNFSAILFLQSEIGGGQKQINGLQWMFGTPVVSFGRSNITVKLYHTTDSVLPASPTTNLQTQLSGVSDITKVLDDGEMTIAGTNGTFSTLFTFEQNFCYNGTDNLIIQVEDRSNTAGTNYTNMWEGANNAATASRGCWDRSDVSYGDLEPVRGNWRNNVKLLY
jgi:hypothetical protein